MGKGIGIGKGGIGRKVFVSFIAFTFRWIDGWLFEGLPWGLGGQRACVLFAGVVIGEEGSGEKWLCGVQWLY